MRLGDLDALEHELVTKTRYMTKDQVLDVAYIVNKAPTIDAVPVVQFVRCMNCTHWKKDVPGCTEYVGRCELANYMVGATGYCVYGERKEETHADSNS